MTDNNSLNPLQYFTYITRYARWNDDLGRREKWEETVNRYVNFFAKRLNLDENLQKEIYEAIYSRKVMPSMRCLMTAGPALERDEVAGYNCAYNTISGEIEQLELNHEKLDEPIFINICSPIDFDEMAYILMVGTGIGYSVETKYVSQLPKVGKKINKSIYKRNNENYPGVPLEELSTYSVKYNRVTVEDSKYGWASAIRIMIIELYSGNFDITWDVSKVRPEGAPLKVFGGRASGPQPLVELFQFLKKTFKNANGRKLSPIECYDICCMISKIIVSGGVRRSASISFSDLSDDLMRKAKNGNWWIENGQRALSNNSAAYEEKPDFELFMREMSSIYKSRMGERGIFNRAAVRDKFEMLGREWDEGVGVNPCGEILLRPKQFCNLSTCILKPEDTFLDVVEKIKMATLLGTMQSTLTDFKYLRKKWSENTKSERLLGVSMTGIMDHPVFSDSSDEPLGEDKKWFLEGSNLPENSKLKNVLIALRGYAREYNKNYAQKFGINPSKAITTIKPEGTTSTLCGTSSGIHVRYARYYKRRVRNANTDPVSKFLIDSGFPYDEEGNNYVFTFYEKSPESSIVKKGYKAIDQLKLFEIYSKYYVDHNVSSSVYYTDNEFYDVCSWIWNNFEYALGLTIFPHSDHIFNLAPFEEISEEEYLKGVEATPVIDWNRLIEFENEDMTTNMRELSCSAGGCEI